MLSLCLITVQPHIIWCDFLNKFAHYKIFMVVDDNSFDCTIVKEEYKNITFIQINNDICDLAGFTNMNFTVHKFVTGWEKAMYYFSHINTIFSSVWFIEDDVFFTDECVLLKIDNKYPLADLLSNKCNIDSNSWLWNRIDSHIKIDKPHVHGMMCAVRLSRNLIQCVKDYASKYHTLFFLEALFPTLAIHNDLLCRSPIELSPIFYRHEFKTNDINMTYLFHPVKNIEMHPIYRNMLSSL